MNYSGILIIVAMVAVMYFLMIRPQQRQRKQHQDMVSQLKKGDEVITIGRLHGTVDEVNTSNRTVVLDCEGIYLTFDLSAIATVVRPDAKAEASTSETTTEDIEEAKAEPKEVASDATTADSQEAAASEVADDSEEAAK
ncbi:preprotein translocase subunit YajC [Paucilactobacillus vaccinostercus DSM 20634]|jgi:preprotein translocase, YajC subunit|uniref:Preprotein translocase subunit YajC n=1 Tax=Paucilactobacillus vaccinostercus DSM 20634 TaxID=1423813 RepID=A0A0R2A0J8_9LACO|nr:preprotein translocase subunit YajC [Paucilactobacillus vaccinostercus]KRM60616.1 preprotein translocase subunit YajC [Paucilactobacillus vaccinostercus DSM 20634]RRG09022.1 MAG: preprotein translocase subunit YajC [Lactobacillus sp.]